MAKCSEARRGEGRERKEKRRGRLPKKRKAAKEGKATITSVRIITGQCQTSRERGTK